jgi:hypothetical protein
MTIEGFVLEIFCGMTLEGKSIGNYSGMTVGICFRNFCGMTVLVYIET